MTVQSSESAGSAQDLFDTSIVIDCLNGSALTSRVVSEMKSSGIAAVNLTAVGLEHDFDGALNDLAGVIETIAGYPNDLVVVRTPEDIRDAKRCGRVGIVLGMQDGEPLGRDLSRLRVLYEMGVRIIQLTHNRQNQIGTGCAEPDSGLTKFGRSVVAEMNRLGIIVDLSHCGPRTTMDAIELSAAPVICSHSNPIAISKSRRNKSDEIIKALAEQGGIIGVSAWSPLVYRDDDRRPTIEDVLDCVEHVLGIVGDTHIAFGSDICRDAQPTAEEWAKIYGSEGTYPEITGNLGAWYRFGTELAEGIDSLSGFPALAEKLLGRGHDPDTIGKFLGANFLALYESVVRAAGREH